MMFELPVLRAILAVERGDTTPEEILPLPVAACP